MTITNEQIAAAANAGPAKVRVSGRIVGSGRAEGGADMTPKPWLCPGRFRASDDCNATPLEVCKRYTSECIDLATVEAMEAALEKIMVECDDHAHNIAREALESNP